MTTVKSLNREQFDRDLPMLRKLGLELASRTPKTGWIRSIRTLLEMSSPSLARRLNIAHSGLLKLEKGELSGSITLASLRRVAAALDADFVYALVPRKSIGETVRTRAQEVARARVTPVAKSMQLEAQGLTAQQLERRVQDLALELENRPRELWR
jgi:predicted DNA-binding mobile mystery protein A